MSHSDYREYLARDPDVVLGMECALPTALEAAPGRGHDAAKRRTRGWLAPLLVAVGYWAVTPGPR